MGKGNEIDLAKRTTANVLITGATGTGKTRLAEEIHRQSELRHGPFVVANLATLHEGTLEAELFGVEKGAYTGANHARTGFLRAGNHGTVLLDEIGELTLPLQSRLLEFLQSRSVVPLGSHRGIKTRVRVIAATHQDLQQMVRDGRFREDLYHRLRVIEIKLSSLSDGDINFDEVVHQLLEELSSENGVSIKQLNDRVAERLENYSWPGNYRELKNVLEYASLSCVGGCIEEEDLPSWFIDESQAEHSWRACDSGEPLDYHTAISQFEREYLSKALARFRGRINRTAREIGMNKTTFMRRLRAYGIHPDQLV